MSVLYLMVPASIFLALIFLGGFFWSVRNGQYEDTYTPSVRILLDDLPPVNTPEKETKPTEETLPPSSQE